MKYPRSTHSFDWHGFVFSLKLLAVCVVVANVARFGFLSAQSLDRAPAGGVSARADTLPLPAPDRRYDPPVADAFSPLSLANMRAPSISADAYLVADIDSRDAYLDRNAEMQVPIASISKLMTALVVHKTIGRDSETKIPVPEGYLLPKNNPNKIRPKTFAVGDLFYPLLMESSNGIAKALADYYGTGAFVGRMNATARSLGMHSTHFAEPSGLSPENASTADDLFRLAAYLTDKQPFLWDITRTRAKAIVASDASSYPIPNFNKFIDRADFIGGKVGYTDEADHTMVSLFSFTNGGETHRVAFIVLQSKDEIGDTKKLLAWFEKAAAQGAKAAETACATCAQPQPRAYRKIGL